MMLDQARHFLLARVYFGKNRQATLPTIKTQWQMPLLGVKCFGALWKLRHGRNKLGTPCKRALPDRRATQTRRLCMQKLSIFRVWNVAVASMRFVAKVV